MKFNVTKALREKIYVKLALFSPSGGGKTYSALRLAKGMMEQLEKTTGEKKQVWIANNEGSRGKYYANEFDYKIIELIPPHSPEMYSELIEFAEKTEDCGVLIIDSLSKEWAGEGGILELAGSMGGTFQNAWKKVSPRHRKLMEKLVESNIHIIATMRGEDQYESYKDEKSGKNRVEKIGIGAKQGKDFEYEFTVTLALDQKTNSAEAFKDNTHLFEDRIVSRLTEEDGANIINWANESQIEPVKTVEEKPVNNVTPKDDLGTLIGQIDAKVIALLENKNNTTIVVKAIEKHVTDKNGNATNNYKSIKDVDVAKNVLAELGKIEG